MQSYAIRTIVLAVATGLVTSAVILVGAWWFDQGLPASRRDSSAPIEDLVAPKLMTDAELEAAKARKGTAMSMQLDQGAWVQVAGKDGRIAQQYTAERINPQPGAFLGMTDPRTVFYLDDGRVATLRANSGRVHVPNRALESGTFSGDVVIRVYRPLAGASVNLAKDAPALILESEQLDFDQIIGQITCPTAFRLTTDMLTFDGEGLDLLLGRDSRTIERLTVERPLSPIVIDRARESHARSGVDAPSGQMIQITPVSWRPNDPKDPTDPTDPTDPNDLNDLKDQGDPKIIADAQRYYRLELHDDVEVLRYSSRDRAWTKGDELVAIFTLKNDLVTKEIALGSPSEAMPAADFVRPVHAGIATSIATRVIAAQQEPVGDLLVVRFSGQLKMVPVTDQEKVPETVGGMHVRIDGEEVELANSAGLALRAKDVDIDLVKDAQGRTAPQTLTTSGSVEATDVTQTIWCENLRAQFESVIGEGSSKTSGKESTESDPALGPSEVTRVDADRGVQIQLKDGARVFADGMVAFPPLGRAELRGPGLAIVRAGVLIDGIQTLTVDDRHRTAESPSGGHARSWEEPIVAADLRGKIAMPASPESIPEMDATWQGEMRYTDLGANGANLHLSRDVKIRAQPRPEEFDALDAQSVRLEMDRRPSEGGSLSASVAASSLTPSGGDVRPRRLVATGDARIENQVWPDATRTGEPRLFQLRGQTIDYDAATGEAFVPSAGSVLVNIPEGSSHDSKAEQSRSRDLAVAGGGVEGISRFRWGSAMNLKRLVDGKYMMTMDQSVELVRAGPQKLDTLTLTCDRLEATLDRHSDAPPITQTGPAQPFNLGGSAELQRVRGIGRCFVRTPEYDVECEEFDYNVVTQIAQLRARAGRLVNVLPKGQGTPLRAQAMTWDLESGRIQIRSGSGTLGQ